MSYDITKEAPVFEKYKEKQKIEEVIFLSFFILYQLEFPLDA